MNILNKIKRRNLAEALIVTPVLFFLFFSPPIIRTLNTALILSVAALIYLVYRYRGNIRSFKDLMYKSSLYWFIAAFTLITALVVINVGVRHFTGAHLDDPMPYAMTLYRLLLIYPSITLIILAILDYAKRKEWTFNRLTGYVLLAFTLQAAIGVLALAVPTVREFLIVAMAENTGSSEFENQFELMRRFYGFANTLLDPYGYALGIVAVISMIFAYLQRSYAPLLLTLLFLIMAVLNSRTGLIVFFACLLLLAPYAIRYIAQHKHLLRPLVNKTSLIGLSIAAIATIFLGLALFNSSIIAVASTKKAIAGYFSFVTQTNNATTDQAPLFQEGFWRLPDDAATLLVGSGHSAFSIEGIQHTDVGYINDLWSFGILGTILLYAATLSPVILLLKGRYRKVIKGMALALLVAFFVFSMKGMAVTAGMGLILTILLACGAHLLPLKNYNTARSERTQ